MRKLAVRRVAVSLALCAAVSACSSAGSESVSEPVSVSVVKPPFEDCANERQPAEQSPRMLLETDQVEAPGEISFRWAPDIKEVLRDVGVYCWVGDSWKLVWFVRDYAGTGRLQLVLTEADNLVQEGPVPAVSADVRVPAEAPPGWYRAGGGPTGERGADFEVISSDAADR